MSKRYLWVVETDYLGFWSPIAEMSFNVRSDARKALREAKRDFNDASYRLVRYEAVRGSR